MFNHVPVMRGVNKFFGMTICAMMCLTSCNRMATPPAAQILKDAEARVRNGDYLEAINLYERSLDGSPKSAETHYRLALLYDDKMRDPLNAMHHFKRYLTLAPTGARAEEVKVAMKRDELALVTEISGDSVVSRAEGAQLRNENLNLRKALDDARNQNRQASAGAKPSPHATHRKTSARPKKAKPVN